MLENQQTVYQRRTSVPRFYALLTLWHLRESASYAESVGSQSPRRTALSSENVNRSLVRASMLV
jgi:hypothetical protein